MITVNIVDMGAAAAAGGVRYDLPGGSVIVIHAGLNFDEQTAMLTELTVPGELPVIETPVERVPSPVTRRLRAAAMVASLIVLAACAAPPAAG